MKCLNPECDYELDDNPSSIESDMICCDECDDLRSTTDSDICTSCNAWTEDLNNDPVTFEPYCNECFSKEIEQAEQDDPKMAQMMRNGDIIGG